MSKTAQSAHVITPDPKVFDNEHAIKGTMLGAGYIYPIFEKAEYPPEGGIYVHYKGHRYPKKGFPFPEAVWNNDILKRVTVTMLKTAGMREMVLPLAAAAILPWRMKLRILERTLSNWNRIAEWLLKPAYLTEDRYSNPCRSLRIRVESFLLRLGVNEVTAYHAARNVATIFEYDDAYRYRMQDIMSEAKWAQLKIRPIAEVRRLIRIFEKREKMKAVKDTMKPFALIATLALLHPKVRKAFKATMEHIDHAEFEALGLDEADRYNVLQRGDYDFMGRSLKERMNVWVDMHTFSKCCHAAVVETASPAGDKKWITTCVKCKKTCEWTQSFPPEFEIAK